MVYSFNCCGHENITARHKNTFEFTKDEELSLNGDCIIGVNADFSLPSLKSFIKSLGGDKKITITMGASNYNGDGYNEGGCNNKKNSNKTIIKQKNHEKFIEKISCEINPDFNSDKEMVIRKSDFISERTFAVKADKAAFWLDKDLVEFMRHKESNIRVTLSAAHGALAYAQ